MLCPKIPKVCMRSHSIVGKFYTDRWPTSQARDDNRISMQLKFNFWQTWRCSAASSRTGASANRPLRSCTRLHGQRKIISTGRRAQRLVATHCATIELGAPAPVTEKTKSGAGKLPGPANGAVPWSNRCRDSTAAVRAAQLCTNWLD